MIAIVKRAPVVTFALLAYAISWAPWFVSVATGRPFGGLFPFGPMIAAFLVAMIAGGRAEARQLGARLVRWQVPARWWLTASLIGLAPLVVTVVGVPLLGGSAPNAAGVIALTVVALAGRDLGPSSRRSPIHLGTEIF
jgi:CAAX protease family protein